KRGNHPESAHSGQMPPQGQQDFAPTTRRRHWRRSSGFSPGFRLDGFGPAQFQTRRRFELSEALLPIRQLQSYSLYFIELFPAVGAGGEMVLGFCLLLFGKSVARQQANALPVTAARVEEPLHNSLSPFMFGRFIFILRNLSRA